ncbi:helix-hairpin-helix domain-containing protein [bacterium]|nr:helix-hairpin-helix domain-containing protein [candidate division CSSED10-310 bacterium]
MRNLLCFGLVVAALLAGVSFTVGAASQASFEGVVDLNTASVEELSQVPYIGQVKAERIVAYRTENGPFEKVEDLMNVKGIGEKTFNRIKDHLAVSLTR